MMLSYPNFDELGYGLFIMFSLKDYEKFMELMVFTVQEPC